ncbi:hypothetical protein WH52_13340 [Tenacibaculum holothuriorum]|uniref:Lipid/polyisoprenoid-binding YceI-like domain-containing protein n=2 Tax=Tenacibaculum holothuriorum TaxID=1635173 RepID=A0A1Y2P9I0_9FLAO|nr:hypothetical protein WH52_13340 [Tenacibaculum holothuriorum]
MLLFFLFFALSIVKAQQSIWKIDPSHSKINFGISYFKIGEIKGNFDKYEGAFISDNENFENTSVNISIETASINTNQKARDKHLKTKDFFDAETHPKITFESTSMSKVLEKEYKLKGNFTMTGITKPIELKAIYKGSFLHPRYKKKVAIFKINGTIFRKDFKVGTNYPPAKLALGNNVVLDAEIHLTKQ